MQYDVCYSFILSVPMNFLFNTYTLDGINLMVLQVIAH